MAACAEKNALWGKILEVSGSKLSDAPPARYFAVENEGYGYETAMGRACWPSPDPMGEEGGENLYEMVGNEAVNSIDDLGQKKVKTTIDTDGPGSYIKFINNTIIFYGPNSYIDPNVPGIPIIPFTKLKLTRPQGKVCCYKFEKGGFTATGTSTSKVDIGWLIRRSCQARCQQLAALAEDNLGAQLITRISNYLGDEAKPCADQPQGTTDQIIAEIEGLHDVRNISEKCKCQVQYNKEKLHAYTK